MDLLTNQSLLLTGGHVALEQWRPMRDPNQSSASNGDESSDDGGEDTAPDQESPSADSDRLAEFYRDYPPGTFPPYRRPPGRS